VEEVLCDGRRGAVMGQEGETTSVAGVLTLRDAKRWLKDGDFLNSLNIILKEKATKVFVVNFKIFSLSLKKR
jgi:hypothetical protein